MRDVFAMHRRQLERIGIQSPPRRPGHRCSEAGGVTEGGAPCGKYAPKGERCDWHRDQVIPDQHSCNRGGRVNGQPVCWWCYVESQLYEAED